MEAEEPFESFSNNKDPELPAPPASRKPSSVSRAWTPQLAKTHYTTIVRGFLNNYSSLDPPLSIEEAMFVIHLMQHKWNENAPYPGYRRLARLMGVSDKSVRRYAKSLEKKKYLIRIARPNDTNKFDLRPLFDALEKREAAKEAVGKILKSPKLSHPYLRVSS